MWVCFTEIYDAPIWGVSSMMYRLRRYDVFRFAQNDIASLRAAMMRCLPDVPSDTHHSRQRSSFGETDIICRRQTSFKKPDLSGRQIRLFCWRRVWDSNPRAQRANGFQEVYQRIPFPLSSVQFRLKQSLKILILQGFSGLFGTDMN